MSAHLPTAENQRTAESGIPPSDLPCLFFPSLSFSQTSFCLQPNFCSPHFHALQASGGDQASSQGQKTFAHKIALVWHNFSIELPPFRTGRFPWRSALSGWFVLSYLCDIILYLESVPTRFASTFFFIIGGKACLVCISFQWLIGCFACHFSVILFHWIFYKKFSFFFLSFTHHVFSSVWMEFTEQWSFCCTYLNHLLLFVIVINKNSSTQLSTLKQHFFSLFYWPFLWWIKTLFAVHVFAFSQPAQRSSHLEWLSDSLGVPRGSKHFCVCFSITHQSSSSPNCLTWVYMRWMGRQGHLEQHSIGLLLVKYTLHVLKVCLGSLYCWKARCGQTKHKPDGMT